MQNINDQSAQAVQNMNLSWDKLGGILTESGMQIAVRLRESDAVHAGPPALIQSQKQRVHKKLASDIEALASRFKEELPQAEKAFATLEQDSQDESLFRSFSKSSSQGRDFCTRVEKDKESTSNLIGILERHLETIQSLKKISPLLHSACESYIGSIRECIELLKRELEFFKHQRSAFDRLANP